MAFTENYAAVLKPFVSNYQEAKNKKARGAVLKDAADAVRESRDLQETKGEDLPKDLPTVCFLFHYYHFKPKSTL
jgi:hypothetical protein